VLAGEAGEWDGEGGLDKRLEKLPRAMIDTSTSVYPLTYRRESFGGVECRDLSCATLLLSLFLSFSRSFSFSFSFSSLSGVAPAAIFPDASLWRCRCWWGWGWVVVEVVVEVVGEVLGETRE